MFIWPILLVAILIAVVWYARDGSLSGLPKTAPQHSPGLDVLEERYARGEIDREEYQEKRRDLGATP